MQFSFVSCLPALSGNDLPAEHSSLLFLSLSLQAWYFIFMNLILVIGHTQNLNNSMSGVLFFVGFSFPNKKEQLLWTVTRENSMKDVPLVPPTPEAHPLQLIMGLATTLRVCSQSRQWLRVVVCCTNIKVVAKP